MQRPSKETLIKYFQGGGSPEEEEAVQIYLAMNIDREHVVDCLQEALGHLAKEQTPSSIDRQDLDRLYTKFKLLQQETATRPFRSRTLWYAYAAAIAFLIASSAVLFYLPKNRSQYISVLDVAWQQVNADIAKLKTVTLPDNSTVTLFPGTIMEVPNNFNGKDRHIKLNGRAFFQVSPNSEKPFYVTAQGLTTSVLGTSFEVNAFATSTENRITLHTGKISIQHDNEEIAILKPNQRIHFQRTTGQYEVFEAEAVDTPTWLNGTLDYDQETLKNILHDLENWYGVKIGATDPTILRQKITVSFKGLSLNEVLNVLSKSGGFAYAIEGKQTTIKHKKGDYEVNTND